MPIGWKQLKRINPFEYIYPSNEEILQHGKPVLWKRVMLDCSLNNLKELSIALKTSIGALNKRYAMPHLANKLNSKIKPDMFYPTDDSTFG